MLVACSGGTHVQNGRLIQKRKYTQGFYFRVHSKTQITEQKKEDIPHKSSEIKQVSSDKKWDFQKTNIKEKSIEKEQSSASFSTKNTSVSIPKITISEGTPETFQSVKTNISPLVQTEKEVVNLNPNDHLISTFSPYPWEVRNSVKTALIVAAILLGFVGLLPFGLLFFKGTGMHFLAYWFFITLGIINILFFIALNLVWGVFIGAGLILVAFIVMIRGYYIPKPKGF